MTQKPAEKMSQSSRYRASKSYVMSAEDVKSPSPSAAATAASERVADHLRKIILAGEIGPGERIRQEEIADRFGMSRLPVREALRMLELEGLTELQTNRGARVPALTSHEADMIYRMRESLEPLVLGESIDALSDADIAELSDIQDRIEARDNLADFMELDRAFHLTSYRGCTVEPLASTVVRLWNMTQHYRREFVRITGPSRRWVVIAEHRLLLDAITQRDRTIAATILKTHVERTRMEILNHPEIFTVKGTT
ncbi:GntR family transcriptional regulator [Mycolicibacterium sp. 018/SC-01/001]|uniref:GntR family transcriptional regulator n=1 Tax=Mycolicibacterium sp. 018/SC-01/001 TaxID=2592069 RepID=UPI002103F016|nr:GntR family transcriptional regulator [Mycolicibacterium sp. 018/SC-01/001]